MQVMDSAARYRHELRLAGLGNGPLKPIRRRCADPKEIGWYGFAAQGGCTRILDRPWRSSANSILVEKNPAHSAGPRQQRHLAVRAAKPPSTSGGFARCAMAERAEH